MALTLFQLKEQVDKLLAIDANNGMRTVCIPNNKGGIGGISVTEVASVGAGIDWDKNKFFIWPENNMIESKDQF